MFFSQFMFHSSVIFGNLNSYKHFVIFLTQLNVKSVVFLGHKLFAVTELHSYITTENTN